jgi:hypothetical protein
MDFLKRMTLSGLNGIQRTLNEIKTKVETCDLSRVEREFENFNRHLQYFMQAVKIFKRFSLFAPSLFPRRERI